MKKIYTGILIGAFAGALDVVPMLIRGLCWYANASAFLFWVSMGIIIPSIDWRTKEWVKGFIVAEMCVLPIIIFVAKTEKEAIVPIFTMTAILGSLVGYCSSKYINKQEKSIRSTF